MNEEMTNQEFKTILEMILMILKSSKDLDEAIEKIESLDLLKK